MNKLFWIRVLDGFIGWPVTSDTDFKRGFIGPRTLINVRRYNLLLRTSIRCWVCDTYTTLGAAENPASGWDYLESNQSGTLKTYWGCPRHAQEEL